MNKQIWRNIAWGSSSVMVICLAIAQYYPDNKTLNDVAPIVVTIAFVALVVSVITMNVRSRTDKSDPVLAKAPPLPTFGAVLQKSFLYMLLPAVALTVVAFAIAFLAGWRPA